MTHLELRGLEKKFGETLAVADLNLQVNKGEFFALLGPSGCGKTTTMRLIAGLEKPTAGEIHLAGRSLVGLDPADRDVAMVFQDYALYPHMNILENVGYPLKVRRVKPAERVERVREVAVSLRIDHLLDRRPSQLSGGQQQRAAVGRAVVYPAQLLLMDEPLSNLDAQLRFEARSFLKKLQKDLGLTVVYVTHDQVEAMGLADRIAVMQNGRVQQVGTPRQIYQQPANTFVASFIGQPPMNLVNVQDSPLASWAAGLTEVVTLGIRPEHLEVHLQPAQGRIPARVNHVEYLGAETVVTVELAGQTLAARLAEGDLLELPETVYLGAQPHRLHGFDGQGQRI